MENLLLQISVWAIPVLFAITVHEAAHGWVAWRLGDSTAYVLGRVTFNPLRHIDPFGTVIMPALLLFLSGGRVVFGYAKPVPVNFSQLNHPRRDTVLVAAAGPGVNMAMAAIAAMLLRVVPILPDTVDEWVGLNLVNAVWINVLFAVFNMLPIPPLDGGRVIAGLLPPALSEPFQRLEPYGFPIIIGVVFILPWIGHALGLDLNVLQWLVVAPAMAVSDALLALAGIS